MKTLGILLALTLTTHLANAATIYVSEDFEDYVNDVTTFENIAGSNVADLDLSVPAIGLSGSSAGTNFSGGPGNAQTFLEIVGTERGVLNTNELDLNDNGIYWTFVADSDTSATLTYDANSETSGKDSFWRLYNGSGTGGTIAFNGTVTAGNSANENFTLTQGNTYTLAIGSNAVDRFNGAHIDNVVITAVPEPGSYALLLAGLLSIGCVAARRRF